MSHRRLLGAVSAVAMSALALGAGTAGPAAAFDFLKCRDWHGEIPDCDPYAYEYRPPRYYPYYNSRYWRPAWAYRRPYYDSELPPYGEAWGYPVRRYRKYDERRSWWDRVRPW